MSIGVDGGGYGIEGGGQDATRPEPRAPATAGSRHFCDAVGRGGFFF